MDSQANGATTLGRKSSQSPRPQQQQNQSAAAAPATTTISTIVLNSKPIQLVIALLQSGDIYHIKVVEIAPKFAFLGANIEEAVQLQRQHDVVFKQLQIQNTPIDEFVPKAEQLLRQQNARPEVLDAMGHSLTLVWNDVLDLLRRRKHILDSNANLHEKIGACTGKMSALEMACRDTMIPIEIESVQEFLNKFKQLRIEVLASVMVALKEGNELLACLREIAQCGTLDSRPDHIKVEVKKAVTQVEVWLEDLHDRRNLLELAWQTRKIQLEQCLALAIFAKELNDLETTLRNRKNEVSGLPNLGDSETTAMHLLQTYVALKQDAVSLRDKALKITRATEKLVTSGCFAGDEACAKAYNVLSGCTEFLDTIDHVEHYLVQSKEFFGKAERALSILEKLEIEVSSSKHTSGSTEAISVQSKVLHEIVELTQEPLRLGYAILADIGRSNAQVSGIERVIEDIENRKVYLEDLCSSNSEHLVKVSQSLTTFMERHNSILSWLVSIAEALLRQHSYIGTNLHSSGDFLKLHHTLLSDLEIRGSDINNLLLNVTEILNEVEDAERKDIDSKVESIHSHWTELKNIVENRVDLVTTFMQFLQLAESLSNMFEYVEKVLRDAPEKDKLQQLDAVWSKIKPAYEQLKSEGARFMDETSKVADPYLETKSACSCVEEVLSGFSNRQLNITENWENWTVHISEQRETETLLEQIMTENVQTMNAATKLDAQLYPIITSPSDDAAELQQFLGDKLTSVLLEIGKANAEIQQRIDSTSALTPKDDETRDKVTQVISNLQAIKTKLDAVSGNYKALLDSLIRFVGDIRTTREEIDRYFREKLASIKDENVEAVVRGHEQFKEQIMDKFRVLIANSERIIEQVRELEPPGAKEHDTDRILSLLEQLRTHFELHNDVKSSELRKQHEISKFTKDLQEIHKSLDEVTRQLNETHAQPGESAASAKTIALGFEYFERTTQLLEKRIENFVHTSEHNICAAYPDTRQFVNDEVQKLKDRWADFAQRTRNTRKTIDLTIEYFTLGDNIETHNRNHSTYLLNASNQIARIKSHDEATALIDDIDKYITQNEAPQLDKLKTLSTLSKDIYGFDKTVTVYTDNISLFQSLFKLKSDVDLIATQMRADDANREQQQQLQQQLLAQQEQQQVLLQQQQALQQQKLQLEQQQLQQQRQQLEQQQQQLLAQQLQLQQQQQSVDELDRQQQQQQQAPPQIAETLIVEQKEAFEMHTAVTYEPPKFVQPLCDATVQEGGRFTFECTATGQPAPSVEWFKDGMSIQQNSDYHRTAEAGYCTLTIDETLAEDSARYTCRATNSVGMAETNAYLAVKESTNNETLTAPQFTTLLQNGAAKEGGSYEFRCNVTGNPLPTVQWYKNDVCIDNLRDFLITFNNGEAILRFEEVFLEDQATFTCKATNPLGYVQCSASLRVEPIEPTEVPVFRVPLSNVMARVGQKIKLECEVIGIPPPELYWTQNGKPFSGRDVKLQRDHDRATLVIGEAFPKDAGVYIVTARNLAGEAYSSCNVTVKGRLPNETSDSEMASDMEPIKPSVQLPLKDTSVFEGKSVRLDCVIVGQPEPEVIWYHDSRPVKESEDVQLLFQGDRCSLIVQEAFLEDIGEYKVVAINSAGEASSRCTLAVTPLNELEPAKRSQVDRSQPIVMPPKFERLLSDILADEGALIEFECSLVGDPQPSIKWFLNNKEILADDRIKFVQTPDGTVKLIIDNVLNADKGVYTVKATNSAGDAKCFSHLIVKTVNAAEAPPHVQAADEKLVCPTFKELFSDKIVQLDDVAKFECIVVGKPTPKVKWLFNDQPVHGKDFLMSRSGDRQVLTIPKVSAETVGKIACVAENEIGKATCMGNLSIIGEPNAPSSEQSERFMEEYNTESSNVTIKKQTFTTTHTTQVNTTETANGLPQTQIHGYASKSDQQFMQVGQNAPEIVQSNQLQEYRQTNDLPPTMQQKSIVNFIKPNNGEMLTEFPKSTRKTIAPRFVTPFNGKIVDQGGDVMLEAIVDGYPSPEIKITKNGEDLFESGSITISNRNNKVNVELKNVNVADAGRYSILASNVAGSSTSTADVVVKKSIFPPVFGHRLQAQVVKRNERVLLDVEVSGTPDPTVTWFKDNKPLKEAMVSDYTIKHSGNNYTLIIGSVKVADAGKYMVRAVNAGGEAQSIADFAVIEPTPERMVEVVKTVVFENVRDQKEVEENTVTPTPHDPLSHTFHSHQLPSSNDSDNHGMVEQTIITETRRTTEATMRMEHKNQPDIPMTLTQNTQTQEVPVVSEGTMFESTVKTAATNTDQLATTTDATQTPPQTLPKPTAVVDDVVVEDAPIDTSSISKHSSLEFFSQKILAESMPPSSDEKYTKFEDLKKPALHIPIQTNDTSRLQAELAELNLLPGTPPEMGFMPKMPEMRREPLAEKVKKLEESNRVVTDAPSGGVRTLPPQPKIQVQEQSTTITTHTITAQGQLPQLHQEPAYTPMPSILSNATIVQQTEHFQPQPIKPAQPYQEDVYTPMAAIMSQSPVLAQQPKPSFPIQEYQERPFTPTAPIMRPQAHIAEPEIGHNGLRAASPRPSAEGVAMEKLWSSPKSHEPEKHFDSSVYHTSKNEFAEEKIVRKFSSFSESDTDYKYESASETDTRGLQRRNSTKETAKMFENKIKELENSPRHDYDLKAPGLVKQILPRPQQDRPKSAVVAESPLPDIYLEPGSPPKMCYAPRTAALERKQSLVEAIEQTIEKENEKGPSKVLAGAVRMIPPPLKKEEPAKVADASIFPQTQPKPAENGSFPFFSSSERKSFESSIAQSHVSTAQSEPVNHVETAAKWQPINGNNSEPPTYRSVNAPQQSFQIPPTVVPLQVNGNAAPLNGHPMKPTELNKPKVKMVSGYMADTEDVYQQSSVNNEHFESHSVNQSKRIFESFSNHQQHHQTNAQQKHAPVVQQQQTHTTTNNNTSTVAANPTYHKHYRHFNHKHENQRDETSAGHYEKEYSISSSMAKNISMNTKHIKIAEEPRLEPLPYTAEPAPPKQFVRAPPPPSPSKFIKSEFKESDYESDYDHKIAPIWRPNDSDSEPMYYKPIRPVLTPTGGGRTSHLSDGASPVPPTAFEQPLRFDGPPRPKFQPIEKPKPTVQQQPILRSTQQQHVFKPTPVPARAQTQPPPPRPHQSQPQPQQYYTAVTGPPQHIATETKNQMHMRESTESSHRVVNMVQTKRVIQLDAHKHDTKERLAPFPYTVDAHTNSYTQRNRLPPPPTPTKFVPAEFRDTDYESEVESTKIRPLWTPNPSDSDEPQYRRVNAPQQNRSASLPRTYGRVMTPMEFDTKPIELPSKIDINTTARNFNQTQTLDRFSSKKSHTSSSTSSSMHRTCTTTTRDDIALKPASPPQYGFIAGLEQQSPIHGMHTTLASKAQQFMRDVSGDVQQQHRGTAKPILKKTLPCGDANAPQAYREESRVSQYGTKHIDPNTGLIYFKYDFGYEFGIIFPGEGKKIVGGTRAGNSSLSTSANSNSRDIAQRKHPSQATGDIAIPVVHERTANAVQNLSGYMSESEVSQYQQCDGKRKRFSLPMQINIDALHRDEAPPPPTPSVRGQSLPRRLNGPSEPDRSTPIVNYPINQDQQLPKRPPIFITPLKDIAVVHGNMARFECIVQCDPYPSIGWSRNGVPIENGNKYNIVFRNGVCRLAIAHAYAADAGQYTCTGSNHLGTVSTSAELLIPSDQWGVRK